MELDLPLLRRRLVDRLPFTMDTPSPVPAMCAFILFSWECEEIVARLERAESNGKPQDDDTPKDQPDPRQPGPNALAWAGSLAAQANEIEALTTQRDALAAAVDEALNLLDTDQPLQAGLVLMRVRG